MSINLRLMKAECEFVRLGGWGGMHSHFCVQPNYSVEEVHDSMLSLESDEMTVL